MFFLTFVCFFFVLFCSNAVDGQCTFRADIEDRRVSLSSNSSSGTSDLTETRKQNISIYSALVVSTFLLGFADAGLFLSFAISASQKLHNRMFERLLGAKIYFFDTNPVGKCELYDMENN